MPPKRKPVTKPATKAKKDLDADSPSNANMSDEEKPRTPLAERIRRKSGDGKTLDLNMSAASSVEHGESPFWKKSRSDEAASGAESQTYPRLLTSKDISAPVNVVTVDNSQIDALNSKLAEVERELVKALQAAKSEATARIVAEEDLARKNEETGSKRKSRAASHVDSMLDDLKAKLQEAEEEKARMAEELARVTEEKEQLENQYDDALNSTLISFKSPAPKGGVQNSGRKSIGRLSLSGYADEFASLGVSNAELEVLNKRTAELEHIVERQAEEIERLIRKGSVDDSYDMEGMDQKYTQLQDQLDSARQEMTKFREEASRMSGLVESLTSERGVLQNRVRKYQEDELSYEATIAELESLQAECLAMRSEIETYKKRIFNADQTVEQLSRHVETGKNHIFSLEDRLKIAERDLEAAKYDNNALEQVLTRKNTVLNTELNNARSEIRKLRDENGEGKTLNHRLKQENIDLSTNAQRWNAKATEYEVKYHDAESEAKRSKTEVESIKRETAVALRNSETREQEMAATLLDNQTEMGNLSTELRNVKSERDHLVNQCRNLTDQVHEMKHSNGELLNETQKKHEADLVALRQKCTELEALLQSARREKAHYESQFKALQKQGTLDTQAAVARVKEVEQALEAQKKLNARLQREQSNAAPAPVVEQVEAGALVGGRQVTVLGSPAVTAGSNGAPAKRELQGHNSQPVVQAKAVVEPSPVKKPLQRHPTAPTEAEAAPLVVAAKPPLAPARADTSNPLAFWKAKITGQQAAAKPVTALAATTPVGKTAPAAVTAAPPSARPSARKAVTPVQASQPVSSSPFLKRVPSQLVAQEATEAPPAKRMSMVQEVRQELEKEEEVVVSPIQAAKSSLSSEPDLLELNEKENDGVVQSIAASVASVAPALAAVEDAHSRIWKIALSGRPPAWQAALSRVPGSVDSFMFGSKKIQCRLIGSDMLVFDGKSQVLVDRFLDQHGEELVEASSVTGENAPQLPAITQESASQSTEVKKAGLRFKNLRKQPLGHSNDMESQ